jgi:hypothetical protein
MPPIMTHAQFKTLCGLVHMAGLDRQTGQSPAEIVKSLADLELQLRERNGIQPDAPTRATEVCPELPLQFASSN